jgi:hypothetical protein
MMSGLISMIERQNGTAPPEWDTPYDKAPKAEASDPDASYIALRNKLRHGQFVTRNSGVYRSDWYEEIGCYNTMWDAQAAVGVPEQHRHDDRGA